MLKNMFWILLFGSISISCNRNVAKIFADKSVEKKSFHGMDLEDDYQYMENGDSEKLKLWLEIKNLEFEEFFKKQQQKQVFNSDSYYKKVKGKSNYNDLKISESGSLFYLKRDAVLKEVVICRRRNIYSKEKIIFPSSFTSEYKSKNLVYYQPSWDGLFLVIGFSEGDTGFSEFKVFNTSTGKFLKGKATNGFPKGLGGIEWLPNNDGFIYTYIPEIDAKNDKYLLNSECRLVKIENDSAYLKNDLFSKNVLKDEFESPDFPISIIHNSTDSFLFGLIATSSIYRDLFYTRINGIQDEELHWKKISQVEDQVLSFESYQNEIYFLSSFRNDAFELCSTGSIKPDFNNPKILVSGKENEIITDFALTKNAIFYVVTKNGVEGRLFKLQNDNITEIELPFASGKISISSPGGGFEHLLLSLSGWTNNLEHFYYDFEENKIVPLFSSESDFETNKDFIVEEIEVKAHDNENIPLSIVYKKDIKIDGNTPLLITGYGAYKLPISPSIGRLTMPWIENGGIYAIAHVRGGGEKGESWHKGGFKSTKPNTWKDFNSCTEYLIGKGYSNPKKTIAYGASAGGICVGRAIIEKPQLYKAAVLSNAVLNPLLLEFEKGGKRSKAEFGTVEDEEEFKYLLEMDPYYNLDHSEQLPAILIMAGTKDVRVPIYHSAKFAAKAQEMSKNLIYFDVDFDGGHGFNSNTSKRRDGVTRIMTFALSEINK